MVAEGIARFSEMVDTSNGANDVKKVITTKNEIFPKHLYRYGEFDEKYKNWEKAIYEGKIRVSSPIYFNDPYDSSLSLNETLFNHPSYRNQLIKILDKAYRFKTFDINRLKLSNSFLDDLDVVLTHVLPLKSKEDPKQVVRKELEKYSNDLKRALAIICFSEESCNMLMWSHYANNSTGYCLEFDFDSEKAKKSIFPVVYSNKKFNLSEEVNRGSSSGGAWILRAMLYKSKQWEYEREWRYLSLDFSFLLMNPQTNPLINQFLNFKENIKSITLGYAVESKFEKTICDFAKIINLPVYKIKVSATSYDLERIRIQ